MSSNRKIFALILVILLLGCGFANGDILGEEIEKIITKTPPAVGVKIIGLLIPDVPELEPQIERVIGPGREKFQRGLNRSAPWRAMIEKEIAAQGLPQGLIAVVLQESNFAPQAVSPTGAGGLWQFKSATARLFKMRYDVFVDDRFDPQVATKNALNYLKELYQQFGDWSLAMAAYNWGRGSLAGCIEENKGEKDFWKLSRDGKIRDETKNYVPSIYARLIVWQNPAKFGFKPVAADPVVSFSLLPFTDIHELEEAAGIAKGALAILNPQLLTRYTPGVPVDYSIWVTKQMAEKLSKLEEKDGFAKFSKNPASLIGVKMIWHTVKAGQTLWAISQKYNTCVKSLHGYNNWRVTPKLEPGMKVIVFVPTAK